MYIHISWAPLNATDPIEIESEIFSYLAVPQNGFADFHTPWDQCFIACVKKGNSRTQVQWLHEKLEELCPSRFAYVITASPNNATMWRSADQAEAFYDETTAYVT